MDFEPIAKPEWLDDGLKAAMSTFNLALAGKIPDKIKAWMLVTACLRVLRAVYGDDLTTCIKLRERVLKSTERIQEMEAKAK